MLLDEAGISPDELDAELDARVAGRSGANLRMHHPMLVRMSEAAHLNVVHATRRSRYLLVEIEQLKSGDPHWQYRETSPRLCRFSCRGSLPDVLAGALQGKLLAQLVVPNDVLAATTVIEASPTGDGWLTVAVTPRWEEF